MSDAVTTPTPEPATAASPKKASGAKKPATKPTHPPVAEMVNAAIAALKEKKGSSLQAIKKYIAAQYKVDVEKQSTFIKKYLKSSVGKKILIQTKGSGAAGSFKLAEKAAVKKLAAKKPDTANKPAAKKPTAAKKPAVKKTAAAKKPAAKKAPAKPKSAKPAKATKAGKAPTSKPKMPKLKKNSVSKPKKAAAPKSTKK